LMCFIGFVFPLCLFLFLLTTAKGRVEDRIPIPSGHHSVVELGGKVNSEPPSLRETPSRGEKDQDGKTF
jgi:hypothetical protein